MVDKFGNLWIDLGWGNRVRRGSVYGGPERSVYEKNLDHSNQSAPHQNLSRRAISPEELANPIEVSRPIGIFYLLRKKQGRNLPFGYPFQVFGVVGVVLDVSGKDGRRSSGAIRPRKRCISGLSPAHTVSVGRYLIARIFNVNFLDFRWELASRRQRNGVIAFNHSN
ncbi:hypothetical protein K438DRAFT_1769061 [Mycena galopus ATCC 62051]|nr:hypothetical protein K438DRAFT_1769061 [Mycena galopus ATCC 62051]